MEFSNNWKFWPNYTGKETQKEKEIIQNLEIQKVLAELELQSIRYKIQLE